MQSKIVKLSAACEKNLIQGLLKSSTEHGAIEIFSQLKDCLNRQNLNY